MPFKIQSFPKPGFINLGFLLAALLLLGGLGLVATLLYQQQDEQRQVIHTHYIIDQLKALEAHLVDAETGTRGYLVTADPIFLQPYHRALPQITTRLNTLARLVAGNPAQVKRMKRLDQLVRDKMAILIRLSRPNDSAQVLLPIGRQRMDLIRGQVAVIVKVEQQGMRVRQQALHADYRTTTRLIWVLMALALGNGSWSYWQSSREFSRRQRVEQRLDRSQQRYRSLVEHLKVVVFQTDSSGRWTYLNPVWEAVT
ncbi:CHASE3 domain-containing protein [Spirosoma sp.]|uniref:CHASE3 domain-containing protein n=1 Tax=Spirosoma sp. TaxID=1899569 RepID=UPI00262977D5|nr:CHASE3 domain-containing protein [Spirosoma sp.]MCX6212894.1 CHASE3 domain-containing protein [Spirosoma sp.]